MTLMLIPEIEGWHLLTKQDKSQQSRYIIYMYDINSIDNVDDKRWYKADSECYN